MTVDRTYVLATPGLDAHGTYVALSRHRMGTSVHFGRDDFADDAALRRTLSRERPKDMALDHLREGTTGRSERAEALRAMVRQRVSAARPNAEAMRSALAKAAQRVRDLGRGRGHGAER